MLFTNLHNVDFGSLFRLSHGECTFPLTLNLTCPVLLELIQRNTGHQNVCIISRFLSAIPGFTTNIRLQSGAVRGTFFFSLPDGDRLTRMQLKQQSLEQCGQRRASLSFSMQMKQRNTSAMLCIETEESRLGSVWHYSRKNHHHLHTVYTVTNWPWCLCLTTKISHTHITLISPWNNLI